MMTSQNKDIHTKIELICQQGCSVVRQYIEALDVKTEHKETHSPDSKQISDLFKETTETQQLEILEELKTIMAVYDDKDCNDS